MAQNIEKIRSLEAVIEKYKRMDATWWSETYKADSILIMSTTYPDWHHLHFKNFVGVVGISVLNSALDKVYLTTTDFEKYGFNLAHPWQNYKGFKELKEWGVDKRDITALLFSENLTLRNIGKLLHESS